MKFNRISLLPELLRAGESAVHVKGWVRSLRKQKNIAFLNLFDGSNVEGVQIVVIDPKTNLSDAVTSGASISVQGIVKPGRDTLEVEASLPPIVVGNCDSSVKDYVLSKPKISNEFLRTVPHLRGRTKTFGAVLRIRNTMSMSVHTYLQSKGLIHVHTPVLTGLDCEGAGEQFRAVCERDDFFGQDKNAYLTVSGQLHAESLACAYIPGVYTFGPTFRAEYSHTTRHLAEFWMVEPELGFAGLGDIIETSRGMVNCVATDVLDKNGEDLAFLNGRCGWEIEDRVATLIREEYIRMSYKEALGILRNCGKGFYIPADGSFGITTEHEKYLASEYVGGPVVVTDYPKEQKPFYMKESSDSLGTVAAMDLLLPVIGEVAGGSERIDDFETLQKELEKVGTGYEWYLDLRRFGSIPHAGFGLGFDRLVQYICGFDNIRDAIPFPRYPGELRL